MRNAAFVPCNTFPFYTVRHEFSVCISQHNCVWQGTGVSTFKRDFTSLLINSFSGKIHALYKFFLNFTFQFTWPYLFNLWFIASIWSTGAMTWLNILHGFFYLKELTKNSKVSVVFPGRDLNRKHSEYEAGMLTTRPRHSVVANPTDELIQREVRTEITNCQKIINNAE